jgi:hypothetical protein
MRAVAAIGGSWAVSIDKAPPAQCSGRLRTGACLFCFFLLEILARSVDRTCCRLNCPQDRCVSGCELLFIPLGYRIGTSCQRHFEVMGPRGSAAVLYERWRARPSGSLPYISHLTPCSPHASAIALCLTDRHCVHAQTTREGRRKPIMHLGHPASIQPPRCGCEGSWHNARRRDPARRCKRISCPCRGAPVAPQVLPPHSLPDLERPCTVPWICPTHTTFPNLATATSST